MSAGAREVERIEWTIKERPLLHACSNKDTFGDCRLDSNPAVKPDVLADVTKPLPFADDSFAAWVADFPWTAAFKSKVADAMRELMRVAPVDYSISPWTYGAAWLHVPEFKVAWSPGVNQALMFARYERKTSVPARKVT
jgi:hypothetical protein